ncbi:MAG: SpoIID/LytB domain-containing protein [Sedimentisphaerales bacterium]|nr:SpoIID/LytB domain-containing protein [Sedimentisphaerales bacterium]
MSTTIQYTTHSNENISRMVLNKKCFQSCQNIIVILLLPLITLSGCKRRQITVPTPQMDIDPQFWVRVLLLDNIENCVLKINSPFSITDDPNMQTQLPTAHFDKIDTPIGIKQVNGKISIGGRLFMNDEVIVYPDRPHILNLDGQYYRGKLKILINQENSSLNVINLIPIEAYLAGVVGAEMPEYWEPEALKAQAIAARTYCLYTKKKFGENRQWDMKKTAAHQVYRGVSAESTEIWKIINQTKGQVLVCEQNNGAEEIFPTYYSSICGGHTENSINTFGDSFKPLTGVPCPYCRNVAKLDLFFWPKIQFENSYMTRRLLNRYPNLKQLGNITNIESVEPSNHKDFSRLTKIKLVGSNGKSDFIRAEDFRLAIDPTGRKLQSTICQIIKKGDKWEFSSGRGWGHGVGMCQCGAQGMARKGKNVKQILSYYYPDSRLNTIY